MDVIQYEFDAAERRMATLNGMLQSAQACMRRLETALADMDDLGESRTLRSLRAQARRQACAWRAVCAETERLLGALRQAQRLFADTERELAAAAGGLGEGGETVFRFSALPVRLSPPACLIGTQRLSEFGYPDWLSDAARSYFRQN